jgi:hypothetical protein
MFGECSLPGDLDSILSHLCPWGAPDVEVFREAPSHPSITRRSLELRRVVCLAAQLKPALELVHSAATKLFSADIGLTEDFNG